MSSDSDLVSLILQEISENKIKTKEELDQEIKTSLYQVYQNYLDFDSNQENFRDSYQKLKGYKYVELLDLEEGRFIRYLSNKHFYDIKLMNGGFITEIDYQNQKIRMLNKNKVFYLKSNDITMYMKLNEEEIVKQKIMESL